MGELAECCFIVKGHVMCMVTLNAYYSSRLVENSDLHWSSGQCHHLSPWTIISYLSLLQEKRKGYTNDLQWQHKAQFLYLIRV